LTKQLKNIPKYETGVTLFSRSGEVWTYKSLKLALKSLGYRWIAENVGPEFMVGRRSRGCRDEAWMQAYMPEVDLEYQYIMRDDFGGIVVADTFEAEREKRKKKRLSRWQMMYHTWNGEGPVPGVHRPRGGRYYRRPATYQERKQAGLVLAEEGEVAPRPSRKANNLTDAWDDYLIAARKDRSWKRHRKTQYRESLPGKPKPEQLGGPFALAPGRSEIRQEAEF